MKPPAPGASPAPLERNEHTATVTVQDPLGLHLRTSKDVVRVANQYRAEITAQNLSRSSGLVDVKSILQLMQLQARQGHVLHLHAVGPDASAALAALCTLFHGADTSVSINATT